MRFGTLLIAAFAVLAGLAEGNPAAAETTLRVGKAVTAVFSFTPLDVGMKTGIFKRHGLAIDEVEFAGSAKLQQGLASDSIDIGLGSGPELAFVAKGAPVLGVAAMAGAPLLLSVIVKADGPIHNVADLKGKSLSCTTAGSLTSWMIRELSRQQGWGPDGITVLQLGSDAAQIAALKTGQSDGMPIDLATAYRLEASGDARILLKLGDLVKNFHMHIIYARRGLIAADPDAVRRFLAGWFETIAYMRTHKAETVAIVTPVMNVSPEISARVYDETMAMFSDDGKFEPKALDTLQRSFVEMDLLPTAPDMSKLYTAQFLPGQVSQ
jgi:NitT/TauT family transport system substrate-binding protein